MCSCGVAVRLIEREPACRDITLNVGFAGIVGGDETQTEHDKLYHTLIC